MNPEQHCDHCRVSLVPDKRAAPGPGAGGPGLPVSTAQLYCPKIILELQTKVRKDCTITE